MPPGTAVARRPSFPAEATTTIPAATARPIASRSTFVWRSAPRLRLITTAPRAIARSTASAMLSDETEPVVDAWIERIRHVQQTPADPTLSVPEAAMIPATFVPWPFTSLPGAASGTTLSISTRPTRSGVM